MSTSSKNNPCGPCVVACDGKAELPMTIKKVFRNKDCTPTPCIYQWDADYEFGEVRIEKLSCQKPISSGCSKDEIKRAISGPLKDALQAWLDDKLGGPTTDKNYTPDLGPGSVRAEMEFSVLFFVPEIPDICPPCEGKVTPAGPISIRGGGAPA